MGFTQIPVCQGYKYLSVMIETFTGWTEGFPTWTEKTDEVVKILLHEIIPRFGLPRSLQSDNVTSFILRLPKESLKHWALLITSIGPGGLSLQEK